MMMTKQCNQKIYQILIIILGIFISISISHAKIEVDINEGILESFPIAVAEFEWEGLDSIEFAIKIRDVIINDLEKSGIFRSVSNEAFLEIASTTKPPVFENWRIINANMLLIASVHMDKVSKQLDIKYQLWDSFKELEVERGTYKIHVDGWRRISHKIANSIYKKFLGVDGYFDSRIVFVAESGNEMHKIKRLAIMDQDGGNFRFLTSADDLVLSPSFDTKSQRIIYTIYKNKNKTPKVYVLELESGKQKLVGDMVGMSFSSRFAPDNEQIIMSLANKGATNIWEVDLNTGIKTQLTKAVKGVIDTSSSYSPDGKNIVFNSDRSGSTHVYIMDRDGSNIKKVSMGLGNYRTPIYSPDGKNIAFTKIDNGKFYIGVMNTEGGNERLLTSSWLEEGPSWAPNSQTIIFSRTKSDGKNHLYAVDINGTNERKVDSPTEGSEPSWSSYLE
jgi:TolB protein